MNPHTATRVPIRVLVVDDSAFMRTALSHMIAAEPDLEVAATARSGADALDKIPTLNPDVITLDIQMPGLNGFDTLRCIMNQFPRPVIMVSSASERDAGSTFDALAAGAFDYVPKELAPTSLDILHIRPDLIAKIRAAVQSRQSQLNVLPRKPPRSSHAGSRTPVPPEIVAIGTSSGGPKALEQILPLFPRDLPVPIVIVQHMPPGFTASFAERLNTMCSITVSEASHGAQLHAGHAYIAPSGVHLTVQRNADASSILTLTPYPEDYPHKPSVDVLMNSVAQAYGHLALGVIMTGMGMDGATGMQAIYRSGGITLGQDEGSCAVYGMPKACAELGVLTHVVSLKQIPAQILRATRHRRRVS